MQTVRLGRWPAEWQLRARSLEEPGALLINIQGAAWIARAGHVVKVSTRSSRMLAALFCGRVLSRAELIDMLWGQDPAGGPLYIDSILDQELSAMRLAGAALGFVVSSAYQHGVSARLVNIEPSGA
jgi:hypothetical protein